MDDHTTVLTSLNHIAMDEAVGALSREVHVHTITPLNTTLSTFFDTSVRYLENAFAMHYRVQS